jgi:hypothetical protein
VARDHLKPTAKESCGPPSGDCPSTQPANSEGVLRHAGTEARATKASTQREENHGGAGLRARVSASVETPSSFPGGASTTASVSARGAQLSRKTVRAAQRDATVATAILVASIYLGSDRLAHFDRALTGYCVATVVACFAVTYQVAAFWRRPPSAVYGRALFQALRHPRDVLQVLRAASRDVAAQQFIARRSVYRWLAHMLLSWGTLVGFAVTLPLVWGWLHFEAADNDTYRAVFLSFRVTRFATDGVLGWLVFHALNLAAVAVILGVTYFLVQRVRIRREPEVLSAFHLVPLLLLLAVALTGLALPAVGQVGAPWLLRTAAIAHEATVVALLVALPYGKLIHLFIRPLHLGAQLVRTTSATAAHCKSCNAALAPAVQQTAVEATLLARGFHFAGHQQLCPQCRRRALATAQTELLGAQFQPRPASTRVPERKAA